MNEEIKDYCLDTYKFFYEKKIFQSSQVMEVKIYQDKKSLRLRLRNMQ